MPFSFPLSFPAQCILGSPPKLTTCPNSLSQGLLPKRVPPPLPLSSWHLLFSPGCHSPFPTPSMSHFLWRDFSKFTRQKLVLLLPSP